MLTRTKIVVLIGVEALIFALPFVVAPEWMAQNAILVTLLAVAVIAVALASDSSWLNAFGKGNSTGNNWSDLAVEIQRDLTTFPPLSADDDLEAHHKEFRKAMQALEAKYIHRVRKSYAEIEGAYGVDLGQQNLRFVNLFAWSNAVGVLMKYGEQRKIEESEYR